VIPTRWYDVNVGDYLYLDYFNGSMYALVLTKTEENFGEKRLKIELLVNENGITRKDTMRLYLRTSKVPWNNWRVIVRINNSQIVTAQGRDLGTQCLIQRQEQHCFRMDV
jgi:hypothetical protein